MIKALISVSGFRLRVSYALLCGICFLQLLFLALFIFFTTDLIQQRFEAADFLRQAEVIPLPATLILGGTLLLYPMLLGVMQVCGHVRDNPCSALAFLLLESVICMALLRLTSFAGNQIFLLVAANMLTLTRDRKNRGIGLIIMEILFLFSFAALAETGMAITINSKQHNSITDSFLILFILLPPWIFSFIVP